MVKKITTLTFVGMLLIIITFNGMTGAWFTSVKRSNTNSFQAGYLKIGDPGLIVSGIDVENIYPGWHSGEIPKTITIENSGTLDFKYSISIVPLAANLLYDGPTPIQININETGYIDINKLKGFYIGVIPKGGIGTFTVRFMLPESADNSYSDRTAVFSFEFDAVQNHKTSIADVGNENAIFNAVSDPEIKKIRFTNDITMADNMVVSKFVDIELNGFTLNLSENRDKNLVIESNEVGEVSVSNGTVNGNLQIDIPNGTFNNRANVLGTTTIINVAPNTFNNYGTMNLVRIMDSDGCSFNNQGKVNSEVEVCPKVQQDSKSLTVVIKGTIDNGILVTTNNTNLSIPEGTILGRLSVKDTVTGGVKITNSGEIRNFFIPTSSNTEIRSVYNINKNQYYKSIQEAVDAADNNNSIKVAAGTYPENVVIKKQVSLEGPNKGIHPQYGSRVSEAVIEGTFILGCSNITIDGFKISNRNTSDSYGIRGTTDHLICNNVTIQYNDFDGIKGDAVIYDKTYGSSGAKNWSINYNRINNIMIKDTEAIKLNGIDNLTIKDNYIRHVSAEGGRIGILLEDVSSTIVEGNDISVGSIDVFKGKQLVKLTISKLVSSISIINNRFSDSHEGINVSKNANLIGFTVQKNNFDNVSTALTFQPVNVSDPSQLSAIRIDENIFRNVPNGIAISSSTQYNNFKMNRNKFETIPNYYIYHGYTGSSTCEAIDATQNWFGTIDGNIIKSKMRGNITYSPWCAE